MLETDKEGTIFGEMMERRSRSEELTERALDRGLEVFKGESEAVADDLMEDVELEMKPAFEESEVAQEVSVSENAIQAESLDANEEELELASEVEDEVAAEESEVEADVGFVGEEALEEEVTIPADGQVDFEAPIEDALVVEDEEAVAEAPGYFEDLDGEDEVEEEVLAEADAGMEEPEVEEQAKRPEELIEESDDLLAAEPEPVADAEVTMAAEDLVDRIGPVVDIQSLPKTQPTRVLSKTAKAAEAPKQESVPEKAVSREPVVEEKVSQAAEEAAPAKKKKKKVSLLDSYFKGL